MSYNGLFYYMGSVITLECGHELFQFVAQVYVGYRIEYTIVLIHSLTRCCIQRCENLKL